MYCSIFGYIEQRVSTRKESEAMAGFRQIGQDWCKKEEIPIANTFLLACSVRLSYVELEEFVLALSDRFPTLMYVYRGDDACIPLTETLLLCEMSEPVATLSLPRKIIIQGRVTCVVVKLETPPKIYRISARELREIEASWWNLILSPNLSPLDPKPTSPPPQPSEPTPALSSPDPKPIIPPPHHTTMHDPRYKVPHPRGESREYDANSDSSSGDPHLVERGESKDQNEEPQLPDIDHPLVPIEICPDSEPPPTNGGPPDEHSNAQSDPTPQSIEGPTQSHLLGRGELEVQNEESEGHDVEQPHTPNEACPDPGSPPTNEHSDCIPISKNLIPVTPVHIASSEEADPDLRGECAEEVKGEVSPVDSPDPQELDTRIGDSMFSSNEEMELAESRNEMTEFDPQLIRCSVRPIKPPLRMQYNIFGEPTIV